MIALRTHNFHTIKYILLHKRVAADLFSVQRWFVYLWTICQNFWMLQEFVSNAEQPDTDMGKLCFHLFSTIVMGLLLVQSLVQKCRVAALKMKVHVDFKLLFWFTYRIYNKQNQYPWIHIWGISTQVYPPTKSIIAKSFAKGRNFFLFDEKFNFRHK